MTETFYRTGIYKKDPTKFGGLIYESDFYTNYKDNNSNGSSIAHRIASDYQFDKQCRKNGEGKERNR